MAAQIDGGATSLNANAVRERAAQVADSAHEIARVANEVTQGAEAQTHSLDSAFSLANEMTASLGETTTQAESIAASAE
ncbi:MAG: methyl-accepting chemotaxis protein, partial [Pyrinomonadaceae bacterium]